MAWAIDWAVSLVFEDSETWKLLGLTYFGSHEVYHTLRPNQPLK